MYLKLATFLSCMQKTLHIFMHGICVSSARVYIKHSEEFMVKKMQYNTQQLQKAWMQRHNMLYLLYHIIMVLL